MTSELDSSIASGPNLSVESLTTKNRKKTSLIVNFTRVREEHEPEKDKNGRLLFYCSSCSYSSSVTTNIRAHLKSKHEIDVETRQNRTKHEAQNRLIEYWNQAMENNEIDEIQSLVLNHVLNTEVIQQALINLITVRNLPFAVTQWPEFHAFCGSLNPVAIEVLPSSPATINKMINKLYEEQKDIVRKAL